jgi:hypothetical protein
MRKSPIARLSFGALSALALVHCASADGSAGEDASRSSSEAVVSNTRTFLVPVDARARVACRDEVNAYYCDAASAEAAIGRCVDAIGASGSDVCARNDPRCVRTVSYAEPCRGTSQPTYPDQASCATPRPQNCSFYSACVDPVTPCGEDGYALGYGEKYCTAFENVRGLTSKGTAWRDSVMHCLQEQLVSYAHAGSSATCGEIIDAAFASHPHCYTLPEASICFLPPSDVAQVIGTIGGGELLTARSRKQIQSTIGTCILQIGRWIFPFGKAAVAPEANAASARGQAAPIGMTPDEARAQYDLWRGLAREYDVPVDE